MHVLAVRRIGRRPRGTGTRSVPQDSIMQCPEDRPRRPAGARAADGSRPRGRGDREFIYLSAARGCRSCSA
eukprot:COSAG03_NODE_426_length_8006_cov_75.576957_8_plen_71_part_00